MLEHLRSDRAPRCDGDRAGSTARAPRTPCPGRTLAPRRSAIPPARVRLQRPAPATDAQVRPPGESACRAKGQHLFLLVTTTGVGPSTAPTSERTPGVPRRRTHCRRICGAVGDDAVGSRPRHRVGPIVTVGEALAHFGPGQMHRVTPLRVGDRRKRHCACLPWLSTLLDTPAQPTTSG